MTKVFWTAGAATVCFAIQVSIALADPARDCATRTGQAAIKVCGEVIKSKPNDASAYFNRGRAFAEAKDADRAIADLTKAIQLDPNLAGAYAQRATIHASKGELDPALADADKAISLAPNDPVFLRSRGDVLRQKGDLVRAIADYDKVIALAPNAADAYFGRGVALRLRRDNDRAIADLTKAIDTVPGNTQALYQRGLAHAAKRAVDLAIADYDRAIALDPKGYDPYLARGNAYRQKNQIDLAIADFSKALELDPKSAGALNNRGLAFAAKRDYDRAIADYDTAIAANPKSIALVFNRGRAFAAKGDQDRAIADFTKGIELDPKDTDPLVERGDALRIKRDYDRAVADYTKAIELNPKLDRAYFGRGVALRSKRQYAAATADLTRAIELSPKYVAALVERGLALRDQRDDDRAIADFSAAIELDPKNADAFNHRGFSRFRQYDIDKAVADYERALEIKPRYAGALFNRGLLRGFTGDDAAAIDDFSKAIESSPNYDAAFRARGIARFRQGDFAGAGGDLTKALALSNETATSLFAYLAGARAGTPSTTILREAAARLKPADWPTPAIELLLGTRTPEALLKAATTEGQRCQAQFYLGEWRLLNGDMTEAENSFAAAVDECPANYHEYAVAAAELKRIGSSGAASAAGGVRAGTIELRDITLGPSLLIGRVTFTRLTREAGVFAADRVVIERMRATIGTQTWEIPTIRLGKVRAPEELYRVLAEGAKASRPWTELFRDSVAETMSIKRIAIADKVLESDQTLTGIVMKRLSGGVIGETRMSEMRGVSRPGAAAPLLLKTGEINYRNINVVDSIRVFTGGGNGERRRLSEFTSVDGIEMSADKATIRVGRSEVGAIEIGIPADPMPVELTTLAADLQANRQPDPDVRAKLVRWYRGLLRHLSVERYAIENIAVSSPDGGFGVGGMTMRGFTAHGFDLWELKGLGVNTADGNVRLERFAIEKVDYGKLLDLVLDAAETGKEPDSSVARKIDLLPQIGAVRLAGLDMPSPGGRLALGSVAVEIEKPPGQLPHRITLAIDRLAFPIDPNGPADGRQQLLSMGYQKIAGDARLVLGWRPADKAVVLEDISVTLDEVGRIQASGRLDDADLVAAITDYGKPASLLGRSPTVRRLELAVSDLGFADRFYADVARSSGVARDAVPGSLAEDLTAKVDKDFGKVLAPGSIDALAAFIRRPGRITATVVPRAGQPPVTVDDLQTLGPEALDRLTITIATGAAR